MRFYEDTRRSVIKAITFRLLILSADSVIIYAFTRRMDLTAGVVIISNFSSTVIYVFHERIWNHIHFGKHKDGNREREFF